MYTSVKAAMGAILAAEHLIRDEISSAHRPFEAVRIAESLGSLVDKVMAEGSVYDSGLAAVAILQAQGDPIEASFLLRAYRSTLPRVGYSLPLRSEEMAIQRRVSPAFQDVPGGQVLGRTRDYTLRLLDFSLADAGTARNGSKAHPPSISADGHDDGAGAAPERPEFPVILDYLRQDGYVAPPPECPIEEDPFDVTREPLRFPASRSARLQVMARGEAGALLSLGYAAMRGYGESHAYVAELRGGDAPLRIRHPITGRPVTIGHLPVTAAHVVFPGKASLQDQRHDLTFGYGLALGGDERKAIAMAIVDENLSERQDAGTLTHDDEFVLNNIDSVEASGFVEHLKMPHYVSFQADIQRTNRIAELMETVKSNADHS